MTIEQLQLTLDLMSLKNRVKKLEQIQANYLKALTEYCSTLVIRSQETPGKEKSDG
jgi:tetrahydromethanopterin S-methyltransferase subunit B